MYKEVNTYIEITYQISDSRVITFAENTGSITPYAVDYTLLYFNGDKVVDYDKEVVGFTTKLNPGETQINEESTHSDFDNVVIYQKGYASKW